MEFRITQSSFGAPDMQCVYVLQEIQELPVREAVEKWHPTFSAQVC